jgi:hypothetical protein
MAKPRQVSGNAPSQGGSRSQVFLNCPDKQALEVIHACEAQGVGRDLVPTDVPQITWISCSHLAHD